MVHAPSCGSKHEGEKGVSEGRKKEERLDREGN
jgi:hypothetical protein